MTKLMEIYKCEICGNIVEIVGSGAGTLVCCGVPMLHLDEKSSDILGEKHVPVLERNGCEKTIRVGSIPHPMEDNHFIMFIEAISLDKVWLKRKYLKPGDDPSLTFECKSDNMIVRELCNIHGLWGGKYD